VAGAAAPRRASCRRHPPEVVTPTRSCGSAVGGAGARRWADPPPAAVAAGGGSARRSRCPPTGCVVAFRGSDPGTGGGV